jgi:hypothetical protein
VGLGTGGIGDRHALALGLVSDLGEVSSRVRQISGRDALSVIAGRSDLLSVPPRYWRSVGC